MTSPADPRQRSSITTGDTVDIVRKDDQKTGRNTRGTVQEILTFSSFHPYGIKVRLTTGDIGRVQAVIRKDQDRTGRKRTDPEN